MPACIRDGSTTTTVSPAARLTADVDARVAPGAAGTRLAARAAVATDESNSAVAPAGSTPRVGPAASESPLTVGEVSYTDDKTLLFRAQGVSAWSGVGLRCVENLPVPARSPRRGCRARPTRSARCDAPFPVVEALRCRKARSRS